MTQQRSLHKLRSRAVTGSSVVSRRSVPTTVYMPAKLVSHYSAPVGATLRITGGKFEVWRGFEGTQIVLNWEVPAGAIAEIKIVRKWLAWPENAEDGVLLVHDEAPFTNFSYSDREIDPHEIYYYAVFFKRTDGVWFHNRRFRGKTFSCPSGYMKTKLWDFLPNVYHREDNGEERDERQVTRVTEG